MEAYLSLLPFLAAVFAAASSGAIFKPDAWYRDLAKPPWTPPDWVFPLGWTAIYLLIAVAGWRVWLADAGEPKAAALAIYGLQLVLNAGWSAIFFGLRRIDLAMLELVMLWIAVAANILLFLPIDKIAGLLLLPYLGWVTFAGCLNATVWRMNAERKRWAT